MNSRTWTRREFGKAAAILAGTAVAAPYGLPDPAVVRRYAFVGSTPPSHSGDGGIHVFALGEQRWTPVQTISAAAPAHLLLHPTLPVLYAVHHVDTWGYLPRGAVSTYKLDRAAGRLTHLHTQPLSLAATRPRHAVLTAGASHLFVAAEGGGIYNLLPVAADGTLRPASAIRKEFGLDEGGVTKTAAPHTVALLPDGSLLAADTGQETLTNFTVDQGQLTVKHRLRVHRGFGPSQMVLSAAGTHVHTVACGRVLRSHILRDGLPVDQAELIHDSHDPLTIAVGQRDTIFLGGEHSITFTQVDGRRDEPQGMHSFHNGGLGAHLSLDGGSHLVGWHAATGTLRQATYDAAARTISKPVAVAEMQHCTSLVLS